MKYKDTYIELVNITYLLSVCVKTWDVAKETNREAAKNKP